MKKYQKLTQNQIKELDNTIADSESSSLEVRRVQAILLLNKGDDPTFITGYSRRQCFDIRKRYFAQGLSALVDKRKNNFRPLLTKPQREEVTRTLKTQTPKDLGYEADYWTTGLLGHHIKRAYRVRYKSKTSYYLLFRESKFTYHKPGRVYGKRDETEVKAWQEATKPLIQGAFADSDTVILCEDELSLSTQTTTQKIWLPAGEYPKIEVSNKKESRSVYGFLNIKTGVEHAFKTAWQNMHITAAILKKVRRFYPSKKLLLLWDGPGWHKGSKVQELLKNDGNIEVIHFPRYAPEENPQEHVWKEGRSKVTHNRFIEDIDQATDEFVDHLNTTRFNYSLLGCSAV